MASTMEEQFKDKLKQNRTSRENTPTLSHRQYCIIVSRVLAAKLNKPNKLPSDQLLLEKYDVLYTASRKRLIVPQIYTRNTIFYVHDEELFQIFSEVHSSDHADCDQMMRKLKRTYKNVTYSDINLFLSLCKDCVKAEPDETQHRTKEFNSTCSVDLIDYSSFPDPEFKYILVYQEMFTKFSMLKSLKEKDSQEVAGHLINFFGIFGPPNVLQTNDVTFVDSVIEHLKKSWRSLEIGRVKLENTNNFPTQDVEIMMLNWMRMNSKSRWSEGVRFVQLKRNTTINSAINKTPYEMLFNYSVKTQTNKSDAEDSTVVKEEPVDETEYNWNDTQDEEMTEEMEICKTEPKITCEECGFKVEDEEKGCTHCRNRGFEAYCEDETSDDI